MSTDHIVAFVRGTAERGYGKVERGYRWGSAKAERGYRWSAGKRSAVPHFYTYRTRIDSHSLLLATAQTICTEYAMHIPTIYTHSTIWQMNAGMKQMRIYCGG